MDARVKSILKKSLADRLGILPGDSLLAVNGNSQLEDLFDYRFEVAGETCITLEIQRPNGTTALLSAEKEGDEDPGIEFESPIFTPLKTCNNACPFCFIDQQPEGLRESLYVKDDDYRLSCFCSTYVTLTNLTRHDRERIARIRPGPLYISVHSTLPEIRERMLQNRKAGRIMKELRWLASLGIPFHTQLVICPGMNDGDSLIRTLQDLASLQPHCMSVAVVPIGLTSHRKYLPSLRPVDKEAAQDVIARIRRFEQENQAKGFAFASDEFYVRADCPIPAYEAYGDFPQLEDGVGAACLLSQEFIDLEHTLPAEVAPARRYVILTGELGAEVIRPIAERLNRIEGLFLEVVVIENRFWGDAVTVAGLITGQDVQKTLESQNLSGYESILIPETMLKPEEQTFLDDYPLAKLEQKLGCRIHVVSQPSRAHSLLDALFGKTLSASLSASGSL